MRISTPRVLLTLSLFADASAVAIADDSTDNLTAELLAWKASLAGQEAAHRGYLPKPVARSVKLASDGVSADELVRFRAAKATIERLAEEQPTAQFHLDTPFALLTKEEFAKLGPAPTDKDRSAPASPLAGVNTSAIVDRIAMVEAVPTEVDWQKAGCTSNVRDQGYCAAGWAFAGVGAVESGYCAKSGTKRVYDLSTQDALSCGINGGCGFGSPTYVYDWMANFNGGSLCPESAFPYTSQRETVSACYRYYDPFWTCAKPDVGVASFVMQRFSDHTELEKLVADRPVTSLVKRNEYLQFYAGGVLRGDEDKCPAPQSIFEGVEVHDVLIVGYGVRDGIPYWKVKNSWGPSWGEAGYAYIERGYQGGTYGACGIEFWVTYPVFMSELPASFKSQGCEAPRAGVELVGQELKVVSVSDGLPMRCCDICRREQGCKGWTWLAPDNACRLLSTVTGEKKTNENLATGVASSQMVSAQELKIQQCLPIEQNVDFPSNDVAHALATTPGECCNMCSAHDGCNAYTWSSFMGGSCFMKRRRPSTIVHTPPSSNNGVTLASGIAYKCQPFQVNADFQGADLGSEPANAPLDCCGICRNKPECVGSSWTNFNGGTCWLKRSISGSVYKEGVFSVLAY